MIRLLPWLLLTLVLAACGTPGSSHQPLKHVAIQTTEPLNISDERGSIRIIVRADDTFLEVDQQTFICRGKAGYIGRFDIERGWLKVGQVEFGYDPEKIWIRGRKQWNSLPRAGKQTWMVSQAGEIGRSILRR